MVVHEEQNLTGKVNNPFKSLESYGSEGRDALAGLGKEMEELYGLLGRERLVLIYGEGSRGKSDLIRYGLSRKLGITDWWPIFIRRGKDINESLQLALMESLEGEKSTKNLVRDLEEIHTIHLRPVYLIFDQLEELFISGNSREQAAFFEKLAQVVIAKIPCRILLLIDEQYLAKLLDFEAVIPNLFKNRLKLESLDTVGQTRGTKAVQFLELQTELLHLKNTSVLLEKSLQLVRREAQIAKRKATYAIVLAILSLIWALLAYIN